MSKNFMKKTLAGIFALVIVASSTPIAPFVSVMNSNSITASAETASETDFDFDASSGTITKYTGTGGDVEIPSKIGGVAVTSIGDSAFEECYDLTSVTIPEGVTSIGDWAFLSCSSLASVTIPEGVTSIGDHAFMSCSNLASVTIPEGVTSIGVGAFAYCSKLASVTIPEGVTSIGVSAFSGCSSLTSVTIPEGVTSIGDYAFMSCSNLASVTIPEGVTSIGDGAFEDCWDLTSVTIPEGVTKIGDYAFGYCSNLASVTIPEGVTSIGDYAFDDCASLTSITAPCTLKNSMSGAMGNCKAKITYTHPGANREEGTYKVKCAYCEEEIDYTAIFTLLADEEDFLSNVNPEDYTEDSWKALDDSATALAEIVSDFQENKFVSSQDELTAALSAYNGAKDVLVLKDAENFEFDASSGTITKYTGTDDDVKIPATIDGVPVTSIGEYAFICSSVKSVIIPDSVTSIGEYAFRDCQSLVSVTIPEGVTSIGECAFYGCEGLVSVTIPESVTSIGNNAFHSCSGLKSITLPESLKSIGDNAFMGCSSLTSVTIPESVTSIGNNAFHSCSGLKSITLPKSLESIGSEAFTNCSAMKTVNYTGSETDWKRIMIDSSNNERLLAANITYDYVLPAPESVFNYTINSVLNILQITGYKGEGGNVKIPATIGGVAVTSIGGFAFEDCQSLVSVTIPEGVTSIGECAFFHCEGLVSVTIPESVTSIGMGAFAYCSELASVTIPEGVTSIGESAFEECYGLISVTIPDSVTSIGDSAFSRCTSLTNIKIPDSVTSIGASAFSGCTSLTNITIPESVTSIGECAFQGCACLASVTIPEGVTSIGGYAFSSCQSLVSVTIPEGVTSIGECAFQHCYDLTSVTIPEGVTSIGECAFQYCYDLTSVTIPEGVTSIGNYAFDDCASLTNITAPCSLKDSMENAMGNCTAEITYTHKYSKNGYVITCTAGGETFDYTDVFAALDEYDGSNESNYTADSWEDYSDAAAAIKTLTDNFGKDVFVSEQAELTDAVSACNTAKDALVLKDADYTELDNAIAEANDYTADNYTADSWTALQNALAEANTVNRDLKADQQGAIDTAKNNLLNAINGLVLKDADYTELDAAIADAEDYDEKYYTAASWTAFQNALAEAKAVDRDLKEDQQDTINTAKNNLRDAINGLKEVADTSRLEAAIADADVANEADYSASVWSDIQEKVAEGNTYVGAGLAADDVQGDVDAVTDELNALLLQKLNDADYTAVDAAISNIPDDLSIYTDASVDALIAAYKNVVRDLKEDKQGDVDAMAKAIEDAIAALKEKPKYDTLYEYYLVTAPTVSETGTYNKRAYHYENDDKVIDTERVFTDDMEVTFEEWYLRTLIQYQVNGSEFDLRFVSMLDENLDQYQKAGFIFTINGTEVSDELSTTVANTSYIVDGKEVNISAFSQPDDYFFLQKYVFDISEIDLDATLAVTAYVVLADGTELQGTKAVTFTLRQFEG